VPAGLLEMLCLHAVDVSSAQCYIKMDGCMDGRTTADVWMAEQLPCLPTKGVAVLQLARQERQHGGGGTSQT
jgi:hypothetical protein